MTTTTLTKTKTTCWNCREKLQPLLDLSDSMESLFELVVEISRVGEGRQQRALPLCHRCAETFGKES